MVSLGLKIGKLAFFFTLVASVVALLVNGYKKQIYFTEGSEIMVVVVCVCARVSA